jgi:uncharacterized protein involved in high-affinity Fe2+ transport
MADIKISQLTAKAAKVESTDRIPIADFNGTTYDTKYVTGAQINELSLDTSPQLGGNLDVNGHTITSDSDQDVIINPNGVGITKIESDLHLRDSAGATAKEVLFYEGFSNGTNYIALKAANSLSTNTTYTLPTADGTSGQVLQTNGTGTLSWTARTGYTYEIGQYVSSEGGVIFHRYIDNGVQYYLVVDTTNLSTSSAWSNVTSTLIGSTAQSTWNGLSNSNAIVGQAGFTSGAAKLCLDSTNNSKSDWYLPAIDELSLLWQNRFNVNTTLSGNSSFGNISGATQILYNSYWSSTEFSASNAWNFFLNYGYAYDYNKINTYYVRAVRKFSI